MVLIPAGFAYVLVTGIGVFDWIPIYLAGAGYSGNIDMVDKVGEYRNIRISLAQKGIRTGKY